MRVQYPLHLIFDQIVWAEMLRTLATAPTSNEVNTHSQLDAHS